MRRSIRYDATEDDSGSAPRRRHGDPPPAVHLRRLPASEALARLEAVARGYANLGRKELLVIHGRGRHSPGGQPVLGPLVRQWCDAHPELVVSWRAAPPEWGGEGALVLTLC
jgi:DNA-nicking Smr family endonuclease